MIIQYFKVHGFELIVGTLKLKTIFDPFRKKFELKENTTIKV